MEGILVYLKQWKFQLDAVENVKVLHQIQLQWKKFSWVKKEGSQFGMVFGVVWLRDAFLEF